MIMDFDDLLNSLTELLGHLVENLPEGVNLMEEAQDKFEEILGLISSSDIELNDDQKSEIVSKIADAINATPESVSENLDTIMKTSSTSFADQTVDKVTGIPTNEVTKGQDISFTSIGCWDECIATVDEAGKRLTCGYHS